MTRFSGSSTIHTDLEIISSLLGFFIGTLALIRYYSKKDLIFLFVGSAFLGVATLDTYHTIMTSGYIAQLEFFDQEDVLPWSWFASRLLLSVMLYSAYKYIESKRKDISEKNILTTVALFTLICFTSFTFLPLPPAYFDLSIGRPEELIPAFFFLLASIGFYRLKNWQYSTFHHFLILGLITSLVSQSVFMATSQQLYDYPFQVAHLFKIFSYLFILTGLLINTFSLFTIGESNRISSERSQKDNINKGNKIKHLKEEFIFIAAHEIKGPVTAIQWNLDTLKENLIKDKSRPDNLKLIKEIESSNSNLINLVNNLLNITNLEFQKLNMKLEPQETHKLIKEAIKRNQHHQDNYKVNVINLTNIKTPSVLADQHKLKDILYNVIGNGIKYNKKNGELLISAEQDGDFLHLFFKDTGMGIAENELEKIFQKFYRSERAKEKKVKGTGLGLFISQKIIEKMNGSMWAESEGPNKGSTIHIKLPLAKTSE